MTCRWCASSDVPVALDLGCQPPADYFPPAADRGADPVCPLQMGVCGRCGLAQLRDDPGTVEEPLGREPQALLDQAAEAVGAITAAGLGAAGFVEFDSPHGGSWRDLLTAAGGTDRTPSGGPAELVVDVFGLMHAADQAAALRARAAALAPDGTLLLQFHSLSSIVGQEQWNALRHGHFAYYSTAALAGMLAEAGLHAFRAWEFDLYGGTVLLAARRHRAAITDPVLQRLLEADRSTGLTASDGLAPLTMAAERDAAALRAWLAERRAEGSRVIGYGAASRAVPLLVRAGIGADLLPVVADGSPAKAGRRMPASSIRIVPADVLRDGGADTADVVLLFVPDLLREVRAAYPEVEARGARWAISEPSPRFVPSGS